MSRLRDRRHAIGSCVAIVFLASSGLRAATLVTPGAANARWSARNTSTSGGKVLWFDQSDTVLLYEGGTTNTQVQALVAGTSPGSIDDVVFTLGSGSSAGQVIGGWRRGTDDGWVFVSGGTPKKMSGTNPYGTGAMNPEGIAIADGCVYMALQAPSGNTTLVKHVFKVDPATGNATLLTGGITVATGASIPTAGAPRISTSDCAAAWVFDDGSGALRLQFYPGTGTTLTTVDTGDSNTLNSSLRGFHLSHGKLVYEKVVGGIRQVFLYDSTAASPAPVALTSDASGGNFSPRTDGRHVAWLRGNADGTQVQVVLAGGLTRTDASNRPADIGLSENPLQLQRGQLLWQDLNGKLRYDDGSGPSAVDVSPSTTLVTPWLADGFAYWLGQSPTTGANRGVFQLTGTAPADALQPAPPFLLTATAGDKKVDLAWDRIAGASSYAVYLAEQSGVTRDNYASLAGGRKVPVAGAAGATTITGLTNNKPYYFAVSALAGSVEGPSSREAAAAPIGTWVAVAGLSSLKFYAVAADRTYVNIAYASSGANVYKTVNGGVTWTVLGGGIAGRNVRALAVDDPKVYAATPNGEIFRSQDGGGTWTNAIAGALGIGEQNASIALDPAHPGTIYAGDFKLASYDANIHSFVIKSVDGGVSWNHLPNPTTPLGAELRAYAIAVDPSGVVYAGGTGTPNVARSVDGGASWSDVHIPGVSVFVHALSLGPSSTLYAGTLTQGIQKSVDGGASWKAVNAGLPQPAPEARALLVDPVNAKIVHAGTSAGYQLSIDTGETWAAGNTGSLSASETVYSLSFTAGQTLIAGTTAGLHLLDRSIAPPPPPPASADLSVAMTASPANAVAGQNLTFTITVSNAGPDGATGVVLTDALPANLPFVSSSAAQGSCGGTSTVTCTLGTLAAGASSTVTVVVSPAAAGTSSNQAAVTSAVADPVGANDAVTLAVTIAPAQGGGGGGSGSGGGGSGGSGGGGGGCATATPDPALLALAGWLLCALRRRRRFHSCQTFPGD